MSEHVPRSTEPQFPDTPEGQRRRRELTAWVKQNRKQLDLERERDELREKIRALQTEHIAVLAERSTANLTLVVTELQREVSSLKRQLDQVQRKVDGVARSATAVTPAVDEPKPRMPHKAKWRTYRGFRQDMQHREEVEIEAQRGLEYKSEIDIEALSGQSGSDSAKTVKRIMKHYHLDPDHDWPPSTWPEHEPVQQLRLDHAHGLAAMLAGWFTFGMADVLIDHRLDGVVRVAKLLGCQFGLPL